MWTKVHQVSFVQRGRDFSWSTTFQIFDMPIRSGDIRDQSRKLSEIAPKFGRFLVLPNFRGRAFRENCTHVITTASRHVAWKSVMRIFPLAPKLQGCTRWILSQILNFHDYIFLGGDPVPGGLCASKALSISSACKNLRAQHPLRAEIQLPKNCIA